ncbi:MAG: FHA domain-containing protein [Lachnospiraceae bacterium]
MNLTKCNKGHYYDSDKFHACPHCNQASGDGEDVTLNLEQAVRMEQSMTPEPSSASLKSVVQAAATPVAVFDDDDSKTVSYYGGNLGLEPVVGWLVCIEGQAMGRGFELKNGKNFIGRAQNMDIILDGDTNVSRDRHAIVTYEPKNRVFIAQPGDSRELFYLNNNVVLDNAELKAGDILDIGKTQLMFVPFCSKGFAWEDVKNKQ